MTRYLFFLTLFTRIFSICAQENQKEKYLSTLLIATKENETICGTFDSLGNIYPQELFSIKENIINGYRYGFKSPQRLQEKDNQYYFQKWKKQRTKRKYKWFMQESITLFDSTRNRSIPIMLYGFAQKKKSKGWVVISHGYGANSGIAYLGYSFLAEYLVAEGYSVVSIQHELPGDELLPSGDSLLYKRMPFWERGAQNIFFVLQQLNTKYPEDKQESIHLLGHSNGGDMSVMFAKMYPKNTQSVVTLDNLRNPFPLNQNFAIGTMRSIDRKADTIVLDSHIADKHIYWLEIPGMKHDDFCNNASPEQKKLIITFVLFVMETR